MKELLFRVAIPILSIVITILCIEVFSKFYISIFSMPRTHYDYRKKQPAPYKDAPYFTMEFVDESFRQPSGWKYPKDSNLIIPKDYRGAYFNVVDGKRATDFQPGKHQNTVFLFGGSTIYNSEVPDKFTVASYLQTFLNQNYPDRYIVENYGTTTVTVNQQYERLKRISQFRKGDVVIFYDGVNDLAQSVFYANPEETMVQTNRRSVKKMSLFNRAMLFLSNRSKFIQIFFDPVDHAEPNHLSDKRLMNRILKKMGSRFQRNICAASEYSTKHGAMFFHFLQPHLFADERLTDYETKLCQNYFLIPKGIEKSFSIGYPVLKMATKELSKVTNSSDLTDILNQRPKGEEYYFDSVHVNHKANNLIAKNIFQHLQKALEST